MEKLFSGLSVPEKRNPQGVWLPGFVDTHVHYPQTAIIGSASGPLLDWLATSVFPEEAKFSEGSYAQKVASRFSESLLKMEPPVRQFSQVVMFPLQVFYSKSLPSEG